MDDPSKSEVAFTILAGANPTINDEAEEAENEEDQRRRQQELQNMLANAFDDIGIDDDNTTFNSSCNESHLNQNSGYDSRQNSEYDPKKPDARQGYDPIEHPEHSEYHPIVNTEHSDYQDYPGRLPEHFKSPEHSEYDPQRETEHSEYEPRTQPEYPRVHDYNPNEISQSWYPQNQMLDVAPNQNYNSDLDFDQKYRDATVNSLEQLQLLYQVQVREIQRLNQELSQSQEQNDREKQLLKKKLLLAEAEYDGIKLSLKQSQELLVEKNSKIDEHLKEIDYLKNSSKLLQESKNVTDEELQLWKAKSLELEQKLGLIEKGLYVPVSEKQVRTKYEHEINDLQNTLEQTKKDLEHSKKSNAILENEIDGLKQSKEMMIIQKDDEIHNLYGQLENAKYKCQNLTEKVEYLEKEHQNLTVLLNSSKDNNESKVEFSGTVKILQQELKRSLDDQKSKRDEILRLEGKLEEVREKIKRIEEDNCRFKEENTVLKEDNVRLEQEIQNIEDTNRILEETYGKLKEDFDKLMEEHKKLTDSEDTKESESQLAYQKLLEENQKLKVTNQALLEENQWMKENQVWEEHAMIGRGRKSIENRLSQDERPSRENRLSNRSKDGRLSKVPKENRAPILSDPARSKISEKNRLLQPILGDNRQLTDDQLLEVSQLTKIEPPNDQVKPYEQLLVENQQISAVNHKLTQEKQTLVNQIENLTVQISRLNRKINEDFEKDKIKLENIEDENETLKKLTDELEKQLILIEQRNTVDKKDRKLQSIEDEYEILKTQYNDLQKQLKETELNAELWKKQLSKYEQLCLELQETCAQQKGKLYETHSKVTELESRLVLKEKRDELLDDLQQKALMFEQYIKTKTELNVRDKSVDTQDLEEPDKSVSSQAVTTKSPKVAPTGANPLESLMEQISRLSLENRSLKEKIVFDRNALNELTNVWNSEINRLNSLVADLKKELDSKNESYLKNQETVNSELSRMTTIITKLAENLKMKENYIKQFQEKEHKHLKEYQSKKEKLKSEFQSRELNLLKEQAENIRRIKSEFESKEDGFRLKLDKATRTYSEGLLKIHDRLSNQIKKTEEKTQLESKIIEAYYDMLIHQAVAKKPTRKNKT